MSQQTNIAAQTACVGDLNALEEIVAPGSIDHDPAPGQVPGPEGHKSMFAEL
ncbi:hypothetical protein ACWEQC_00770 [Streptomyces shenzhenensis]